MIDYKGYKYKKLRTQMNSRGLLRPLDVLIVGATGGGKSSSINILLDKGAADVGHGVDPKTMELNSYDLNDYFRLWDTPGFGDSINLDVEHGKKIIKKLNQRVSNKDCYNIGFIDMVLVVLEASLRDMGTPIKLLNEYVLPNIDSDRVIVGINQADFAMKGRNFNYNSNKPERKLLNFLEEKKNSIKRRILTNHKVDIPVVYYSAETGYNVNKLLDTIIEHLPNERRKLSAS